LPDSNTDWLNWFGQSRRQRSAVLDEFAGLSKDEQFARRYPLLDKSEFTEDDLSWLSSDQLDFGPCEDYFELELGSETESSGDLFENGVDFDEKEDIGIFAKIKSFVCELFRIK